MSVGSIAGINSARITIGTSNSREKTFTSGGNARVVRTKIIIIAGHIRVELAAGCVIGLNVTTLRSTLIGIGTVVSGYSIVKANVTVGINYERTSGSRSARINRAHIVIIASEWLVNATSGINARVVRTQVVVIAHNRGVKAEIRISRVVARSTGIVGTEVIVIANLGNIFATISSRAGISRAIIVVIAGNIDVLTTQSG